MGPRRRPRTGEQKEAQRLAEAIPAELHAKARRLARAEAGGPQVGEARTA